MLVLLLVGVLNLAGARAEALLTNRWWPGEVDQALGRAGTNSAVLFKALREVPESQRKGLQFLLENMPPNDLQALSVGFLLENLSLAYEAFNKARWRDQISDELFLNEILPFACLNERRDSWRRLLYTQCSPMVENCRTPAEAAQRLNQKLFGVLKVKYSTQRKKPDQSPLESIESGLATCSGLAILLVDACRSIGVPARVAGTPMWVNMRGNHTWAEIWDGGWHFTGAAEQDPKGLDRGWFAGEASQARKDDPRHAIYATSFKKSGLAFPLPWAPDVAWVSAVNVTDRYAPKLKSNVSAKTHVLVKVLDHAGGKRLLAKVTMTEAASSSAQFSGMSKGESADLNDLLTFEAVPNHSYEIRAERAGWASRREIHTGTNVEELIVLCLNDTLPVTLGLAAPDKARTVAEPLQPPEAVRLKKALLEFFAASTNKQVRWKFSRGLEKLLYRDEAAVRRVAWDAYRNAPIHDVLKKNFDGNQVCFEKHVSPYVVRTVGVRPAKGWALFIAMHGGGGAPKEVNDSQWRVMQHYYRDHPEAGGYLYLALRAPDDSWNGFYTDYAYPLVANLIRQFLLFGDVDPNKVFIMGYSHGGYGAFAIGPKMPDRFAAIHASAAAPTDSETTPKTLRSTVFTYMIGEQDTMYGRIDRCHKFDDAIQALRGNRADIYPVHMEFIAGNGHTGLPDRDKIQQMYPTARNPFPRELTWLMTDSVLQDFFWLHVPAPSKGQEIDAVCRQNHLDVTTTKPTSATVLLDARLIDFSKPVALDLNGARSEHKLRPSLRILCETLQRRGDPELAFTAQLELPFNPTNGKRNQLR